MTPRKKVSHLHHALKAAREHADTGKPVLWVFRQAGRKRVGRVCRRVAPGLAERPYRCVRELATWVVVLAELTEDGGHHPLAAPGTRDDAAGAPRAGCAAADRAQRQRGLMFWPMYVTC